MHVILDALSHKAKNRLAEAAQAGGGATPHWVVINTQMKVLFSDEPGPWLFVQPVLRDGLVARRLSRWVHQNRDRDFRVQLLDQPTVPS